MKRLILVFILIVLPINLSAQANKKDVKTFLEVSGAFIKYQTVVDKFTEQLPEESRDSFKKDVQSYLDRLINNEVNLYAASFTQDEILKLIEFYKSPLGIKLIQKTNEINSLSQQETNKIQRDLEGIIMKYFM